MNVLSLITFGVVEVVFIAFIVLIARSGLHDKTNRSFLYFLIGFALWAASNFASNLLFLSLDQLLFLNRLLFAISIVGLLSLLLFIAQITRQAVSKTALVVTLLVAAFGVVSSFLPSVVTGVFLDKTGVVGVDFGLLSFGYFLAVVYLSGQILYRLTRGTRQKSALERSRSKVLFVSIGIAIAAILVTNVLIPIALNIFSFTLIGLLAGMFIMSGVSYGIVRHGMFDIKSAAIRSVSYSLVLITLATLYFILALLLSQIFNNAFASSGQIISGVIISLILAVLFQPVKRFFDRVTRTIFYKDDYDSDSFFAQLNRTLVSTTNLRKLLQRSAGQIGHTLKSEQVFFFIDTEGGRHTVAGTEHHTKLSAADARLFKDHFETKRDIVYASRIEPANSLKRLLLSNRIELVMPLMQGDEIVGLLCLGDHRTSSYTPKDERVLKTISDELVIAIQNALSVHAVTELNEHLQQRINSATQELRRSNAQLQKLDEAKDEFISMASHQLRTPLTSIKGYISMLVEGDAGKISAPQKRLLDEAFTSSERMVRLIGDFLNVSRLQTGKFLIEKHPVDLAKLVEHEIDALLPNANARNLKFVYKQPKNFPMLDMDENKIQQVVMNFADNAIYYSKEKSTIKVELSVVKNKIEFTVKDTGIGVPVAQQDQLFQKFFRATNARQARPDGTGVGLFLAKKVIDAHDGQIIFESKENKGSTFGFRLPIVKLAVARDADKLKDKPTNN